MPISTRNNSSDGHLRSPSLGLAFHTIVDHDDQPAWIKVPRTPSSKTRSVQPDHVVVPPRADSPPCMMFDLALSRAQSPMAPPPIPAPRPPAESKQDLHARVARYFGRPVSVCDFSQVHTYKAHTRKPSASIQVREMFGIYSLQGCSHALPSAYKKVNSKMVGVQSLVLNVLCGTGVVSTRESEQNLHDWVAQIIDEMAQGDKRFSGRRA